jgi:hypothetical protein
MSALPSVFQVGQRHGIWCVKLDGVFFGDYRTKSLALAGVAEAKTALDAAGRAVKVVMVSNGSDSEA